MYKYYKTDREKLMKVNKKLNKKPNYKASSLENILNHAKSILEENKMLGYTKQHPIFSYIKIFTNDIQSKQVIDVLKNNGDNIKVGRNKYYNIVNAFYYDLEKIILGELFEKAKRYEVENVEISNARDPILARTWNAYRITDNIKHIGKGMVNKHLFNNDIKKDNAFEYKPENHLSQYFYPLGVTLVYNGNHSIYSGINKGEGHFKVNEIYDVSYIYDIFYFDGTFLYNKETKEKYRIHFELGVVFEIGRLLLNHPEVFDKDIRNVLKSGVNEIV